jgi:hypothetical protein
MALEVGTVIETINDSNIGAHLAGDASRPLLALTARLVHPAFNARHAKIAAAPRFDPGRKVADVSPRASR